MICFAPSPKIPAMRYPPYFKRGFTLIEMIVSLAVISVLLVGMSSAIVLASKALPHATNPAGATVDSARALHNLRDELRAATELLNRNATSVTLHLPDRDADGRPEVITYAWGGSAGDPLTRTANGGTAATVLDSVQSLAFGYVYGTQDTPFPGPMSESNELLFSSFDHTEVSDPMDNNLQYNNPLAIQITPNLPAGVDQYTVTRVLLYGRADGHANSDYSVQVRPMNGDEPADTVTELVMKQESDLTASYNWVETAFSNAGPFDNGSDFAIVLEHESENSAGQYYYDNTAISNLIRSSDGGATWTYSDSDRLPHFVYGTYEKAGDDWTLTRSHITRVQIELVHGDADAITQSLALPLPNAPEAATQLWEADFNADPTTLDNADSGVQDWMDDGTFNAGNLSNGRWEATDTLFSWPNSVTLDQPFTIDAWIQDTVENSNGGGFRIRFDRDGALQAYVHVEVDLLSTGQMIRVVSKDAVGVGVTWHTQTQPAGESIHVALAVDPGNDTVAVSLDGEVVGSFAYDRFSGSDDDTLRPFVDGTASGVYFDHLRLATGGTATITPGAYTNSSSTSSTGDDDYSWLSDLFK